MHRRNCRAYVQRAWFEWLHKGKYFGLRFWYMMLGNIPSGSSWSPTAKFGKKRVREPTNVV